MLIGGLENVFWCHCCLVSLMKREGQQKKGEGKERASWSPYRFSPNPIIFLKNSRCDLKRKKLHRIVSSLFAFFSQSVNL